MTSIIKGALFNTKGFAAPWQPRGGAFCALLAIVSKVSKPQGDGRDYQELTKHEGVEVK